MEREHNRPNEPRFGSAPPPAAPKVTAFFEGREEVEIALADLERNGVTRNRIGMLVPENENERERRKQRSPAGRKRAPPQPPAAPRAPEFRGWTATMAPWSMAGAKPVMAVGFLSLILQRDRPKDLPELRSRLGLGQDATEPMQEGLQRRNILVAVEETPERQDIVSQILTRNGGHILPYKKRDYPPGINL